VVTVVAWARLAPMWSAFELVDGALVTGLGGVVALGPPADDEESVALVQGLGGVLGPAAPGGDGQVDGVGVLPLPGRVVLVAVV